MKFDPQLVEDRPFVLGDEIAYQQCQVDPNDDPVWRNQFLLKSRFPDAYFRLVDRVNQENSQKREEEMMNL